MRRAKSSVVAILAASLLVLTASVGAVSANDRVFVDVVPLSGANEVIGTPPTCAPPTVCGDPDARGVAVVVIFPAHDLVCWTISWRNVNGTVHLAHIHGTATPQQAAPVLVDFTSNIRFGCIRDTDADAIAANPSMYYVNVHSTPDFPAGAIRGQLG
jgi:CHRD domain